MNRRSFIGSVIGMIGAFQFRALTDSQPWQRIILPYRVLYKGLAGTFQAPGIDRIVYANQGWHFWMENLNVIKPIEIDSMILLTEKGKVITESPFTSRITAILGDQLRIHYSLLGVPSNMTVEEAVEIKMKLSGVRP